MSIDKAPAIIIGLDSMQGLQSARVLASHGIPVIGLAEEKHDHGCHTNVCSKIVITKTEGKELIDTLLKLGKTLKQKAVMFTCQEKNVLAVSKERDELKDYYHIILPEHKIVDVFMDKEKFYEYAINHKLPVPKTFTIKNLSELNEIDSQIRYPCILKPSSKSSEWIKKTSLKAFAINSKEEFQKIFSEYIHFTDSFIISEWISGPDTNHFTCNSYFNKNGEELVSYVSRKVRQWPPKTGQGCFAEEVRNDEVLNLSIKIFKDAGFKGLTYLDLKKDDITGNYFIIEPNIGRPTGRAAMAEASGVDYLYTMYCDLLNLPLPENRKQLYKGVKWMHIRRDLMVFFVLWWKGEITFSQWWKSLKGPKVFAVYSKKDPLPFFFDFFRVFKSLFK